MTKVLILCTGNSCRSQMAQAYLGSLDPDLCVCSAGTKPADRVHPMAVAVMREIGLEIGDRKPTSVARYLDEDWDYVITVCGGANETCPAFFGTVKHRLHFGFDDPAAATGTQEHIHSEFVRIRDEIRNRFFHFYSEELQKN